MKSRNKHGHAELARFMQPESLMMGYGFRPELSEGSIKCPIFQTSTFVFKSAEEGKDFFEIATGKRKANKKHPLGLIYSRINNPDLEVLEDRLTLWDGAEACAVFESGMAAIATTMMAILRPGDVLLHSEPLYGGTDHLFKSILKDFGIQLLTFLPTDSEADILKRVKKYGFDKKVKAIFIESPANPTNDLIDICMCVRLAKKLSTPTGPVLTVIDNTFLGPVYQHPIKLGVDIVLYSATKYIGGHSDLIAGATLGTRENITKIKAMRTYLGSMASPWTGWLLMRSLETLKLRMEREQSTAQKIAKWLEAHAKVEKVYYLGLIKKNSPSYKIYKRQCFGPGAMISFDVKGGEKEAFKFLNSLKLIKLAVSLGGTESLAEHPYSMTHCGVDEKLKQQLGISKKMIRLSVGVEDPKDIIWDLAQALNKI